MLHCAVPSEHSLATRLVFVGLIGLFCLHLGIVGLFAVDVPFADEWDMLADGGLDARLSPAWLFAQHNEHRIPTTKLLIWVLYRLGGWNIATQITLNFLLYGVLVGLLLLLLKRHAPELPLAVAGAACLFLLSPINLQNHFWGFQTQFHLSLLFFLAALLLLFADEPGRIRTACGAGLLALAAFSLSSGVMMAVAVVPAFLLYRLEGARHDPARRRRHLESAAILALGVAATLAVYLWGYEQPAKHPPLYLPHTLGFWDYFLNLVGLGFGFQRLSMATGAWCLGLVLAPLWMLWRGAPAANRWTLGAAAVGVLAALAIIAIGRAGLGAHHAKSSRYAEIGMLLVPLSVAAWAKALRARPRRQAAAIAGVLGFAAAAFADDWNFLDYSILRAQRLEGRACLARLYAGKGTNLCPTIYEGPIPADSLLRARALRLSFVRQLDPPRTAH